MLIAMGYPVGRTDGYYSNVMTTQVSAFQANNDLPVTGKIDNATASKIVGGYYYYINDHRNDVQLDTAISQAQSLLMK